MIIALWRMARPMMLLTIFLVYLTGCLVALAQGWPFNAQGFLWGWMSLLAVSVSVHYVNEYADYETDALTRRTPFSGGSGVLPSGILPREAALKWAWVALVTGLATALVGTLAPVAIALLAVGATGGWMYSVAPLKLAWRGWGEVDNAVLGGMILPLFGFAVQAGSLTWITTLGFVPFTLLVFTNLLATTWADRQADAQVGKRTLATFVPPRMLRHLYRLALAAACVVFVALLGSTLTASHTWLFLPVLPFVIWGLRSYTHSESPHASVMLMVTFMIANLVLWGTTAWM